MDGWALVPRLFAPALLGLPLFLCALFCALPVRHHRAVGVALAGLFFGGIGAVIWVLGQSPLEADATAGRAGPRMASVDWPHYGNAQGGSRHSSLTEITPRNVGRLKLAWSTPISQPMGDLLTARFEGTPLKIGDDLYLCTGLNDIVALDAATGKQRWRFAAKSRSAGVSNGICRGIAYYAVPGMDGVCAERLYTATVDARLLAVDARTGRACADFGMGGAVDLRKGMGDIIPGYYQVTSPPQLVRGKLVIGGFVADGQSVGEPSGVIRAFDAVTGKLAWAWDMGRPDRHGEPAEGESYTRGTPNSWAPMSADDALGLVYVPTGNATPDYFGAHRSPEMERYSSSIIAIDAETGIVRWHFQTVHHDVWDYDVAAQPTLIDLPTRNGIIPAVAQSTKQGQLFVLDRRTGKPVFPVTERPVPQKPVAGDWLSPTQPHSSLPSFAGRRLQERHMWGATPLDQLWCRIKFREARYEGPFTPMGLQPTIVQPGFLGGTGWGSLTFDPQRRLLVMVTNYLVNLNQLVPRAEVEASGLKPSSDPRFIDWRNVPQNGVPYGARTAIFMGPAGTPCEQPPYSRLSAVDLTTGKLVWSRPLGTAGSLGPYGLKSRLPITIGTPSVGGAISTASGVTFIAASFDHHIRAFETATGRLLWESALPADGIATPMTYSTRDGRQYLVIGVGHPADGGKTPSDNKDAYNSPAGGTIMAFALP